MTASAYGFQGLSPVQQPVFQLLQHVPQQLQHLQQLTYLQQQQLQQIQYLLAFVSQQFQQPQQQPGAGIPFQTPPLFSQPIFPAQPGHVM